jgi:hypothetical protein
MADRKPWRERVEPPPLDSPTPRLVSSEKVRASRRAYLEALGELRDLVAGDHTAAETSDRARSRRRARVARELPAFRGRSEA